jgi:hypothetical protein
LVRFIDVTGQIAANEPAYNNLVEKLAEFVGARKSEAEGSLLLLRRAQKLDFSDRFDMIRWLGKATLGLSKREYSGPLIEAVQLLMLAYRGAGLLWAARASCSFAAASIIIDGESDSELPISIVPTMKIWAWIALELGHIPDFLFAIRLMNGFVVGLPLAEESKAKVQEDIRELDAALGCLILNLKEDQLRQLEAMPDVFRALGLFLSRTALLYALGHEGALWEEGSLADDEPTEDVMKFLSTLKSQPIADNLFSGLVLNVGQTQVLATTILGMRVEVAVPIRDLVPLAETILGTLEAFFATVIEHRVAPHTELFKVIITQDENIMEPVIITNEIDMTSNVTWPSSFSVARFDQQKRSRQFFVELAGHVMAAACLISDSKVLLETLFAEESVQQRITMIAASPNSYNRVTSQKFTSLDDWVEVVSHTYPLRELRTHIARIELENPTGIELGRTEADNERIEIDNHKGMTVSSVIDVHAWDRATWRGCGFAQVQSQPPVMAFLYENEAAARKIFERWIERFGTRDNNEDIAISVVRHLPDSDRHHYCVQISSRTPDFAERAPKTPFLMSTRSMTMEPQNSKNLELFLKEYERFGAFFLVPGILSDAPNFMFDLSILKRRLSVKSAADVDEHDIEALALRIRGLKFAS